MAVYEASQVVDKDRSPLEKYRGGQLLVRYLGGEESREFAPGSYWAQAEMSDPRQERTYFVVTTADITPRIKPTRGGRKVEILLPSGRRIRVFREGAQHNVKNYEGQKAPDAFVKGGAQDPHDHIYCLEARDACYIAKYRDDVYIDHRRERLELDAGDGYAPDQVCPDCGGEPSKNKQGFVHDESCPKNRRKKKEK